MSEISDVLNLDARDFFDSRGKPQEIPEEEIIRWFEILDACWVHSGRPEDPHAELTTGLCSNGFFDCLRVLKYINLSEILAVQLALKLERIIGPERINQIGWVIGSPMAAITFSHDVAKAMGIPISMFTEKDPANPKKIIWKRMAIPAGEKVLQIEELITTSHTLLEGEKAVREGNPNPIEFVPYVGAVVHRPPKMVDNYEGKKVVAIIEKEIWAVPQDGCGLCKKGSKRLKPKSNWAELTGKK